jgi:hypothetical protein
MLDGLPDELVRIEGEIVEVGPDPGDFVLCSLDNTDTCFDVSLAPRASVFDTDGTPIEEIDVDTFAVEDMVIVIGTYVDSDGDDSPDIAAIVVEKGSAELVKGIVTEVPDADGLFIVIDSGGTATTVELQSGYTKIFASGGEALTADALQVGQGIEVEGVSDGDPAVLRAALIILDSDDDPEQLSGTIVSPAIDGQFVVATAIGERSVCVTDGATVTIIGDGTSEEGGTEDIVAGHTAYVFGEMDTTDGCFDATAIVVDTGG